MVNRRRYLPMPLLLLLTALLVLALPRPAAAEATASLDRNRIAVNESVNLTLRSTRDLEIDYPDLTEIEKNFTIINRTRSSQVSIENGRQEVQIVWALELLPKEEGLFTIPGIDLGGEKTGRLVVTVIPAPAADSGRLDVFLETELSATEVYPRQQVVLKVLLYHASRIYDGVLTEPRHPDVEFHQLGKDITFEATRGGRRYRVIQRQFVLYMNEPGEVELPMIQFRGAIEIGQRDQSLFPGFKKTISATSAANSIRVKEIPAAFTGDFWLPSTGISLSAEWESPPDGMVEGEPIVRTVVLEAQGLMYEHLPEIELPVSEAFQSYPDKPVSDDQATADGVVSRVELKQALVPKAHGPLEVPAVRLPWWNVETDREEIAEIPALAVDVAAGTPINPEVPAIRQVQAGEGQVTVVRDHGYWPYLSAALLIAWLTTLFGYYRARRGRPAPASPGGGPDRIERLGALKRKLKNEDPRAAAEALVSFTREQFPGATVAGLEDVGRLMGSQALSEQLRRLNGALYGRQDGGFDLASLAVEYEQAFRQVERGGKRKDGDVALVGFYPTRVTGNS